MPGEVQVYNGKILLVGAGGKVAISPECCCEECVTCTVLGTDVCLPDVLHLTLDYLGVFPCAACYEYGSIPLTRNPSSGLWESAVFSPPYPTPPGSPSPCIGMLQITYECGGPIIIVTNSGADQLSIGNQTLDSPSPFMLSGTQGAYTACPGSVGLPQPLHYLLTE